ncbi:MAG: group II intron reverse transcriptase/maturase [Okeania sp. SIO2C9]|uniref:group II intron reverse transcriptase/maturase n=1 Tax=Okeania sp. SIO2C9 TaxID=2607791 RepID=UPI0013C03B99|nr:group II intron reverse transcriptase/maturase [Okeania sp. SIO2C9]NEQ72285.1 group II intron reverse transcriptase/maturase [Okeania sp. SIO2C9]
MNKAKTLKRRLGNPKPFLSVAWDTNDMPSQVSVNPNLKWRDINWKRVEKCVFKLQKLIYRASSRGEIRKMRKYQRLLTKSYYARLLAVRRVTQDNQGKKTAGVDGIKNLPPRQRFNLVDLLNSRYLKASPTRRVWIPKPGKNEKRPLGIPTMYDRALQALVKLGMEPEWEARFEPNSYGFRPGRSTHDAIEAIHISINHKPKYVLDADISKCFDRINHDALLGKIGQSPYRRLIKQWLKSGAFDNNQFLKSVEGTPQGGVISPLLGNIALHGMEQCLNKFAESLPGKKRDNKTALSLIRYADDFVILHKDIKVVLQAKAVIQEWLSQIGLELKPEKTKIAHTLEEYEGNKPGFDFLGFTIRQFKVKSTEQGFKTLIKPSFKSIKTHYRKLADICDKLKTATTKALIAKLNPVIRGWANYFSTVVSKEIFSKMNMLLLKRLWGWASRRHPNKSAKWVKDKYFPRCKETRNWVLNDGEYILNLHSDVPIIRHIKVKAVKSPYDGDWTYWSSRIGKHPGVRKEVTTLLKRQKNKCAFCGLTFSPSDLMEVDHIKPRSKGGDNTYENKQLLHRHCHDTKTALDNKTYPKSKSQALPEGYLWVDDMLVLRQGCAHDKGRLGEEPCEVKVSRTVLKTSRVG